MKINKIYINGFGGLKDYSLEFDSGLNVIFGENENGKTTVMNFIKAMFYGTGNKVKDLSKSIREKYRPWDDTVMAGRVYFEDEGRRYCLEREFKKTDSTDKITLTDTDTGEIIPTANGNIGTRFFGVSAESFERSMFIGCIGSDTAKGDESGEINAKLSSLATTGDEDTSYNLVLSNLENAKRKFVAKGKNAGTYTKDTEKLALLKEKLSASKEDAERYDELCSSFSALQTEKDKTGEQIKQLKAILDKQDDTENAEKLREYIKLSEEYENLTKDLKLKDGNNLDGSFVEACKFGLTKIDKINSRIEDITKDIERINTTLSLATATSIEQTKQDFEGVKANLKVLETELSKLSDNDNAITAQQNALKENLEKAQNSKKAFNPALLIAGILMLLAGGICYFMDMPIPAALGVAGVGVVAFILSFIIRPSNKGLVRKLEFETMNLLSKKTEIQGAMTDIKGKINGENTRLALLQSALNTDSAMRERTEAELKVKGEQLKAEVDKRDAAANELIKYFSRYGDQTDINEISAKLDELFTLIDNAKPIKSRCRYLKDDLKGITVEQAKERLAAISSGEVEQTVDFDSVKAEYEALLEQQSEISSQIAAKITELKTGFKDYENPEGILRQINELNETIESEKQFLQAIDIASEVLGSSFAILRRSFGSVLDKKTLEIFSTLTDGKYDHIEVSKGLELKVEQAGVFGTKEIEYLSGGAIDQAYLSLKLAISSLLNDKKAMPIMLDDSLSQYDDARMKRTIEFLKDYSKDSQAIFFTCHNAVKDAASDVGANVQSLRK